MGRNMKTRRFLFHPSFSGALPSSSFMMKVLYLLKNKGSFCQHNTTSTALYHPHSNHSDKTSKGLLVFEVVRRQSVLKDLNRS